MSTAGKAPEPRMSGRRPSRAPREPQPPPELPAAAQAPADQVAPPLPPQQPGPRQSAEHRAASRALHAPTVRVSFDLPTEEHKRLRYYAIDYRMSITELMRLAVRRLLAERKSDG